MVRFHSLQCVDEKAPALEIYLPILGHHVTFHFASWPESVLHPSPGVLRICPEIACPVFTDYEAWSIPYDGEINHTIWIRR